MTGEWLDGEAGPVVRPYAMTSGRTRPRRGSFDLISIIRAVRPSASSDDLRLGPEPARIMRLAQGPISVAELAAYLDLPAGTVKVMLGDLLDQNLIESRDPVDNAGAPSEPVLEAVMHALRAL